MLKKLLLLLPFAALLNGSAQAQLRYTFKDTTSAYVSLPASATSVNGTDIWDEENYVIPMPFTWSLDSTVQLNSIDLALEFPGFLNTNVASGNALTGFIPAFTDLIDRGAINGTATLSPIRYLTTGTTPNRIFKVEMQNLGFAIELNEYNTLDDSANIQIWIYEGSSIVELRYGSSKISNFNDYFIPPTGGAPTLSIGLAQNVDVNALTGELYFLSGPPSAVSIQSTSLPVFPSNGLTAWPANGKVFRFTPNKKVVSGIAGLTAFGNIKVYPNPATTSLNIEGVTAGTKATLYSMLGQPVLQTVLAGTQSMDIAALPAGVYKLVLTNKEGASSATTIVKE